MNNINFQEVKKVLIVRLGKVGDIVATSFVFKVLKENYPQMEINLITLKSNREVLRCNPDIDKVFYSGNPFTLLWNILRLNIQHPDMLMDFNDNPSSTTALIYRFVSAKIKVGYDFKKYSRLINIQIEQLSQENSHIIDRMQNFLKQLGIPINYNLVKPYFYLDSRIFSQIQSELLYIKKENKIIAVNISAGNEIRYWKTDSWIELINKIFNTYKRVKILLLSTEEDKNLRDKILFGFNNDRIILGRNKSIQYFASYIKLADLIITPDTSAVHLASAFGIPVLALYPNYLWNFVSWQPYKVPYKSIRSTSETIKDISVDVAFNALNNLISMYNINLI
jgi:heptosyltransferase-1